MKSISSRFGFAIGLIVFACGHSPTRDVGGHQDQTGGNKSARTEPASAATPLPHTQALLPKQLIPQQRALWYRIVLDPSKSQRSDPQDIFTRDKLFRNLTAEYLDIEKFVEVVVLDTSADLRGLSIVIDLYACNERFETPLRKELEGAELLYMQDDVESATRRLRSSSLMPGFKDQIATITGVVSPMFDELLPVEKLNAVIGQYAISPHFLISVPVENGMSLGLMTIAPTLYARQQTGFAVGKLLPRVRVVGVQVIGYVNADAGDYQIAKGNGTDGEVVEAHFHAQTGILLWEVVETRSDRVLRALWRVQNNQ